MNSVAIELDQTLALLDGERASVLEGLVRSQLQFVKRLWERRNGGVAWTDDLEDERITLIEMEEERDLTPEEAERLAQLMKWSSESRDIWDEAAFQQRLTTLDEELTSLKELYQEAEKAAQSER